MKEPAKLTQPCDDPDRPIVSRFRSGDRSAFDELVRKYERSIVQLVRRYVTVEEDAKDIAQRTFVRVLERIDSFRAESRFRTWLYRIAVNLALDHARGEKHAQSIPIDDDLAFTNSLGTDKLVAAEVWRKVSARLAELPPRQRLVVELRVFHDLSFEEIGAIVDSTEDAAKMNYHHGVKRLRSILSGLPPWSGNNLR
ncbi:MAG: sigma-70 family RNA polymerase sigma factor [Myxococcota bacterium]|nr:sigma-70 family RNA polymerase sigma factor [Myxococcota bacterium]